MLVGNNVVEFFLGNDLEFWMIFWVRDISKCQWFQLDWPLSKFVQPTKAINCCPNPLHRRLNRHTRSLFITEILTRLPKYRARLKDLKRPKFRVALLNDIVSMTHDWLKRKFVDMCVEFLTKSYRDSEKYENMKVKRNRNRVIPPNWTWTSLSVSSQISKI